MTTVVSKPGVELVFLLELLDPHPMAAGNGNGEGCGCKQETWMAGHGESALMWTAGRR